jgi:glycosyltransferase involved in cell wall biosynthesis
LERSALGLDPDAFVVGCFANIRPLKGVDILVRAVERVREQIPHIRCLLVGDSRHKALERYVDTHELRPHVQFLGFRTDVPAMLPNCDVTVMPSVRREGFPRAIVESYSAAVPVICSRVGGMPEIVLDQQTGLVVGPGDVAELEDALTTVALDRERFRRAGQAGLQRVSSLLSLESYVGETIAAYQSVLGA